jgi:hypothetical protein
LQRAADHSAKLIRRISLVAALADGVSRVPHSGGVLRLKVYLSVCTVVDNWCFWIMNLRIVSDYEPGILMTQTHRHFAVQQL